MSLSRHAWLFCLTELPIYLLSVQVSDRVFGEIVDVDLKNNGKDVAVTNDNRKEFVVLYVDYLLNKSIERQFSAFHRGFQKVCVRREGRWRERKGGGRGEKGM